MTKLNNIMADPILIRTRKAIYGKKGIILINASLLAEAGMSVFANNHVIVLKVDMKQQLERLRERGVDEDKILRRINSQFTYDEKIGTIRTQISESNCGCIWTVNSTYPQAYNKTMVSIFNDIVKLKENCE